MRKSVDNAFHSTVRPQLYHNYGKHINPDHSLNARSRFGQDTVFGIALERRRT